jgi:hypothetical protein
MPVAVEDRGVAGRELPAELAEALQFGPFHRALALAIADSGLALSRVEYHLYQRGFRIRPSTLSYWQQGRRRPERADSISALGALEQILEVPAGSLVGLLGPRKARGRWIGHQSGGVSWADAWGTSDVVRRMVAIDSRRVTERLLDVSLNESFQVGADRRLEHLRTNTVTKAREDGADRQMILYNSDPDVDVSKVRLLDLENCRVGRQRVLRDANFIASELLFDRALGTDDTHLFSFRLDMSEANMDTAELTSRGMTRSQAVDGGRIFRRPVHSYVLEARFHPEALPVRIFHVQASRAGANAQVVRELILNAHHAAHVALQNVQPGLHAMRWEWE